jgi:prevent-host-death family protein
LKSYYSFGGIVVDVTEISTAEARKRFADLVTRVSVRKEWFRLTRRGKAVAGAVPLEDFLWHEGPEEAEEPQGIQKFDDLLARKKRFEARRIGESPVIYKVDSAVRRVTSAEARNNLADVLNRVGYGKERIVVTRNGWDLFALIPPEVLDVYVEVEDLQDEIDNKLADEALREAELEGWVPWEVVKKELDLK